MTRILLTAMLALGLGASAMAEEGKAAVRLTADKWCATHDLPKDKDWCAEHNCAESICIPCDPTAKARLEAMRPEAAAAK